ncbi:MAG: HAMP domain-containing histidine kinase [Ignavibacteriae bacterium]|nr:HAMP domain-containing histidine kinase [Ignavibacteriota bacterium]
MKEKSVKIIVTLITLAVFGLIAIQFYWISNSMELEEKIFNKNVGLAISNVVTNLDKKETAKVLLNNIKKAKHNKVVVEIDSNDHVEESHTIKKVFVSKKGNLNQNNIGYDISVTSSSDSLPKRLKVVSRFSSTSDSSDSNIIIWNTNTDTLITNKTKIIENVFDELLVHVREENILDRISQKDLKNHLSIEFNKFGITTPFRFAIQVTKNDSILFVKDKNKIAQLKSSEYKAKLFPNDVFAQSNYLLLNFPDKTNFIFKSNWFVLMISALLTILIIFLFYTTIKMLLKQKKITEVKNDLLNNITHEFKTPISTISLATDVIAEKQLNDETKISKYLSIIREENNRLTGMVENILTTAALEKDLHKFDKKTIDVAKTVTEIINQFEMMKEKTNAEIITNFASQKLNIKTDEKAFRTIITNLIDNALKYNNGTPKIILSVKEQKDGIEVLVKDNGIGISKEHQKKIFDTFYRVPKGNIHNVKGNGIGLSSAKKLVEANQGNISVESKLDTGSTFKIFLPYE